MQELIGKNVKAVIDDDGMTKTIYGTLLEYGEYDIKIKAERDGAIIIVGRKAITILKEA